MTVHVFHIFEVESSGRGKFVPIARDSGAGRGHILIMGGGITCGSVTILETFLRALCRSDSQTDTPEIVLLGQTKCSEKVSVPFQFIYLFSLENAFHVCMLFCMNACITCMYVLLI
jgi:hypothetical protein